MGTNRAVLTAGWVRLLVLLCTVCLLPLVSFSAPEGEAPIKLTEEEKAWLDNHQILKIGITPDWPPFEFIDQDGNYQGLSADFMRLVMARLNIRFEVVYATEPWAVVLDKLRSRELDGVASIFISDKRREYVNFTAPYVEVPHLIITRDGGDSFSSMEQLKGRKLAYMRGWVCQDFLEKDYPGIVLSLNDKIEGMIGQVLLGTTDAGLIDLASLGYYSRRHNLSGLRVSMRSPYSPSLAFGFPKDDMVGAALFNKVMQAASDEEKQAIVNRWLREPDRSAEKIRLALRGVAGLAVIICLVLIWNIQLRRRVNERTQELQKEIEQNRIQALALKESEAKIRAFFDQTTQFIGLLSTDGILLTANLSSLDIIKSSPEMVLNKYFWETPWWTHSTEMQKRLKQSIEIAARGELIRFETTHLDFLGKTRNIDFSLKPFRDQSGKIAYLIAEGRDITMQHESLEALRESEERFRLLFESSADPCWLLKDGKFTECNLSALTLFGFESKEYFLGMHPSKISPEFQPDGQLSMSLADRMVAKALQEGSVRFEWEHQKKDGTTFPVEITLSCLIIKGEKALYCVGRDLTMQRKAEKERKRLEEQFLQAQKMESVGRLAGGVAHDFNNMLGAIIGYTEIALEEIPADHKIAAYLQEIRKAAQRSSGLTRQLLAFARKQTVTPRILDINQTVEGMLSMLRRLIGEDIELNWLPTANSGFVKMDPSQVDQILANLCVNARDAITNTGKVTIETGVASFDEEFCALHVDYIPGEYVMLSVSDNGCGIPAANISQLFEPFYTTKEVGKGTGLGLAMVYGIIKQNDGFISVYSEQGHGSIFKIYLPRFSGETAQENGKESAKVRHGGNETILLVEDEMVLLEISQTILERQGYKVIAVSSPGEAIRIVKEHKEKISLLISDVIMPEMNGRDLQQAINEVCPGLKCLFMSGYTANIIAAHGMLEDGVSFIQKPFSTGDLAQKVRETLDKG